jgi:hypothetical protein
MQVDVAVAGNISTSSCKVEFEANKNTATMGVARPMRVYWTEMCSGEV